MNDSTATPVNEETVTTNNAGPTTTVKDPAIPKVEDETDTDDETDEEDGKDEENEKDEEE